jgi:hypothetical protein
MPIIPDEVAVQKDVSAVLSKFFGLATVSHHASAQTCLWHCHLPMSLMSENRLKIYIDRAANFHHEVSILSWYSAWNRYRPVGSFAYDWRTTSPEEVVMKTLAIVDPTRAADMSILAE